MKTVLVTGANSGIGFATVKLFLERGYFVLAHYHSHCDLLNTIQSDSLKLFKADFSNTEEVESLATDCLAAHTVDVLVNNAGDYFAKDSICNISALDIENAYRVNTIAPFILTKILIERMRQNKWGRIVNISSIGVKYGGGINSIGYTMSKAAIETMTLSFARYAAKDNVLVNCIRAGVTDTDFHMRARNKDMRKRIEMIPMGRMADSIEIAESIYYLASDRQSFATGIILTVAGGE